MLFSVLLSMLGFSCQPTHVDPVPDYEAILSAHDWVVQDAVYPQPDVVQYYVGNTLHAFEVTNVYNLLQSTFPCILDNTFHFDKNTHLLTINTGEMACAGQDTFNDFQFYNETAHTNLTAADYYTNSFMPFGSESSWSVDKSTKTILIQENKARGKYPETFSWTIKEVSADRIVVQTDYSFGYIRKDWNGFEQYFGGSLINLTLVRAH